MKQQALRQAQELGENHGKIDFNARGYVDVVDVVSSCGGVGEWLDTLISDPHAFNEAHAEISQAYHQGYTLKK